MHAEPIQILTSLADAYCHFAEHKMNARINTRERFFPGQCKKDKATETLSLLEWTVSVKCHDIPDISEVWFSMDSRISKAFLDVLGLDTHQLNREMYVEGAKELMNLIIGHTTRNIPELLNTQLSAIYLYISQYTLENKTLYVEDIHSDVGRICILLIQDK